MSESARATVVCCFLLGGVAVVVAEERTWTDATGKFRIRAELVAVESEVAVLKRSDNGKLLRVPLGNLSGSDRIRARRAARELANRERSAAATPAESATASDARTWADATGRFRITAELVSVDADVVVLRRTDNGKVLRVPIQGLSEADQAFLSESNPSVPSGGDVLAELDKRAERERTAQRALQHYAALLADDVAPDVRAAAQQRVATWTERKDQQLVRLGKRWMPLSEADRIQKSEQEQIEAAIRFLDIKNYEQFEETMRRASQTNPDGVTANLILGLYYARVTRDEDAAYKCFTQCVSRRMGSVDVLHAAERANLVRSLNNVALAEIRQKNYRAALNRWKTAVGVGPVSPELVQNIGRLSAIEAAYPQVRVPKSVTRTASELYSKLAVDTGADAFDRSVGWLYMPPVEEPLFSERFGEKEQAAEETAAAPPTARPAGVMLVGTGTGFVVGPRFVVTNRHVIEGAEYVELVLPGKRVAVPARIAGIAVRDDLALLECTGLGGIPPLQLSEDLPRLGQELMVLGYPMSSRLGSDLKVTKGTVAGLPNPSRDNMLLFDAVANPGNSGGPVVDKSGRVVAVCTAQLLAHGGSLDINGGVPSTRARTFLQKNSAVGATSATATEHDDWADVVEAVSPSTVSIQVFAKGSAVTLGSHLAADARRSRRAQWSQWEDFWCMICYGKSTLGCRARGCVNGHKSKKVKTPAGRDQISGRVILVDKFVKEACKDCSGRGHIDCPHCLSGIDVSVIGD